METKAVMDSNSVESKSQLLTLLDIAIREYQHAEIIVQARLSNFLFANSILLVAWATIFAGSETARRPLVLMALAVLSAVLGILWTVMGLRHRKFLFVHSEIIETVENKLPEEFRLHGPVTKLQAGELVATTKSSYRLSASERFARSRNVGVVASASVTGMAVFLIFVSYHLCN